MKISFSADIKQITNGIETAKKNIQEAKIEGLQTIAKSAFGQVESKYIVKGNHSHKSKSGSVVYDSPPGANIEIEKVVAYNPKTKWKKIKKIPMFIKNKIVDRTGEYLRTISGLARQTFKLGSNKVGPIDVRLSKDGIQVWIDSKSEAFFLETKKQAGNGSPKAPIIKTFRSVVNLWKKVRIKLGK